jgi:small subunit ribosomal protein S7
VSRRRVIKKKEILPDSKYKNTVIAKFIMHLMSNGKKSISTKIVYNALDVMKEKLKKEPVEAFNKALENVTPQIEVKSRRVGGSTYQVPVEIRDSRKTTLAIRWIIQFSRQKKGKSMSAKLSEELIDAYNNTGSAFKKKEDTHRMAEANKAFAHYRW